jgi:hypothetical protein
VDEEEAAPLAQRATKRSKTGASKDVPKKKRAAKQAMQEAEEEEKEAGESSSSSTTAAGLDLYSIPAAAAPKGKEGAAKGASKATKAAAIEEVPHLLEEESPEGDESGAMLVRSALSPRKANGSNAGTTKGAASKAARKATVVDCSPEQPRVQAEGKKKRTLHNPKKPAFLITLNDVPW